MVRERRTGTKDITRRLRAGIVAAIALLCANAGYADSAYGCRALETHAAMPAVEAKDGTFFTIRPELQAFHGLGDDTIAMISDLSQALSTRGTTLVLLPVPTRAQVMSRGLPQMAFYLGYDAAASIAVYEDMMRRLKNAGVTSADPHRALRAAALAGERPFFQTDQRPTSTGTRLLASSVGAAIADHPDLAGVARGTFTSTVGEDVTLSSAMRTQVQTACQTQVPRVNTAVVNTTISGTVPPDKSVVLGTSITSTTELNLVGFLSEATGLKTLGYGVPKGGAFAAMSSYLTSTDFQTTPPRVLIWEFPVTASLAAYGDQPLRELIAAASNSCGKDLPLTPGKSPGQLRADLGGLAAGADATLALDIGRVGVPYVRFHFTGTDGLVRTRSIYRHPDQLFTGRFYLPLSGLSPDDLQDVEIEAPAGLDEQTRLALCS
jgi:alginate biosynthesis protein AlgX